MTLVAHSSTARSVAPAFFIVLMVLGTLASVPMVQSLATTSRPPAVSSQSNPSVLGQTVLSDSNVTEPFSLGALPEDIPDDARVIVYSAGALPTHFDWRQQNGYNWMTPVKNQGGCGSCVAFGAVGALEGQLKIQTNNPSWAVDLSEQHLFSCGGGSCTIGWYLSSALNYLKQYGTPDESCSPYRAASGSCGNSCADWQARAYKISSWSWLDTSPSSIEAALMNGPLLAAFTVYRDFFSYRSGVYHYDGNSPVAGGHAIVIVGYDSDQRYWIVKNSWGASWGESGYFRIGFGEAGIERAVTSFRVAVSPPNYTVVFHADPNSGTVAADGVTNADGITRSYNANQRVHVVANPPSGYQFSYWQTNGVSVDAVSSADTYMTVSGDGSLQAGFLIAQPMPNPNGAMISGAIVVPDPSGVDQGSKMTFTITVQNTGANDMTSARVKLLIYRPDGRLASSPSKSITRFIAGTERTVAFTYTVSSSAQLGSWRYVVQVYRSSTLLDEKTDGVFTVRLPSGVIVSVADSPDPVAPRGTASFTVTIKNTGNIVWSTAKITIKIYKPDGRLASTRTLTVRSIQPGVEYTFTKDWSVSSSAPTGDYHYDVYLNFRSILAGSSTDQGNTVTVTAT